MAVKDWPPEARTLYRVLYEDEDHNPSNLPLVISESFFAELVAGCLYRYIERATEWKGHDRAMHQNLHASDCTCERIIKRAADWPWARPHAEIALRQSAKLRRRHDDSAAQERSLARLLDPIVTLHALFSHLVRFELYDKTEEFPAERRGIEFYVKHYFPRWLVAAGVRPPQARAWTPENIGRHFRRCGGKRASNAVAFWLLSTDDRLKPYRPSRPTFLPEPDRQHADLIDAAIGKRLFRLPPSRKAATRKLSRGGQHPRRSA